MHHAGESPVDTDTAASDTNRPAPPPAPITTNIEAWHAVHTGLANGKSLGQIAAQHDLSYRMASNWKRMPRPPRRRLLSRHTHTNPPNCPGCGTRTAYIDGGQHAKRCRPCDNELRATTANDRRDRLRAWATEHRVVPTVREAATILGVSRSTAGEDIIAEFGPDPLRAVDRQHEGRRTYHPSSPSDPIG